MRIRSTTGTFKPIFLYNGRDGVVTDPNGLLYMRARYYSPVLRRFMNADLLAGDISDARTLNRYSYVCGDPVSFVDPFGLSADNWWKFAAGLAVVAGLTVLTVATAGTATAAIAGTAAAFATVGGVAGGAVGFLDDGVDGMANGVFTGTLSGAASGALAATGASGATMFVGNATINATEAFVGDLIDDGKLENTERKMAVSVIVGAAFDSSYLKPGVINKISDPHYVNITNKDLTDSLLEESTKTVINNYFDNIEQKKQRK